MKRWTQEEVQILKNNYKKNINESLPGRTQNAIYSKASKLKLTIPKNIGTPIERFWEYVNKRDINDCWNWLGYCGSNNYGQIWEFGKQIRAHRFSYELHFGKIPKDLCVLHKCDNPRCVNPNHLKLGTPEDNSDDMKSKNRQAKGEDVWCSKLTEDQVKEIRQLCFEGKFRQGEIAKKFNIKQPCVSGIRTNKSWKVSNKNE